MTAVEQGDRPRGARRRPGPQLLAPAVVAAGLVALSVAAGVLGVLPVAPAAAGVASINDIVMSADRVPAMVVGTSVRVEGEPDAVASFHCLDGTSPDLFTDTTALGNGVDLRDLTLTATGPTATSNRWVRTTCGTDVPVGAICVPREARVSP